MRSVDKRERVTAAFKGAEVDHVPVCMWKHVPSEYWSDDDRFAECQINAYRNTDVDFVKLSGDKYFSWPAPILDGIEKADDLFRMEPLGRMHPHIRGQIERTKKVVRGLGCLSGELLMRQARMEYSTVCRTEKLTDSQRKSTGNG